MPPVPKDTSASLGNKPWVLALVMLLAGLSVTTFAVLKSQSRAQEDNWHLFSQQFDRLEASVRSQFNQPVHGLNALVGLYNANGRFNRASFQKWVGSINLAQDYPGTLGFGYMQKIDRTELAKFSKNVQQEGGQGLQLPLNAGSSTLYVVKYIEPQERNGAMWGVDAGDDASTREAIDQAISNDTPVLAPMFKQNGKARRGADFMYVLPVYKSGSEPQLAHEREQQVQGLLFAPLNLDALLLSTLITSDGMLDFELFDGLHSSREALAFSSEHAAVGVDSFREPTDFSARSFHNQRTLLIGERILVLRAGSSKGFDIAVQSNDSIYVGLSGAALSLLVSLSFWLVMAGRTQALAMARAMTSDLDRMARVVRGTNHVVLAGDAKRTVVWVNEAFTRVTGIASEHAMGTDMVQLLALRERDPEATERLIRAVESRQPIRIQLPWTVDSSNPRWFDVELQPEYTAKGEYQGFIAIASDVTQQHAAAEKLAAAIRDGRALMQAIDLHSIVTITDSRGVILEVNDRFVQTSGYQREDLIGRTNQIVNSNTHSTSFWQSMWSTIASGRPWRATVCNRSRSGGLYWVDAVVAPFFDDAGNIEKYVSIQTDVSAATAAKEALAREREQLGAIIDGTNAGTWTWDLESDTWTINHQWAAMLGHEAKRINRLSSSRWSSICHPDDYEKSVNLMRALLDGSSDYFECEMRLRHKNGHWVWVQSRGKVSELGKDGSPKKVSGLQLDISASKKLAEELQESNRVMLSILDNIPMALSVFNKDLVLVAKNDRFAEMLEFPAWLFAGGSTTFESLIRFNAARGEYGDGNVEVAVQGIIDRARNTQPHQFERVRPNGTALEVRGAPMPGGGFVTTYADITDRKRADANLERTTRMLQSVLDSASEVAVIASDLNRTITLFNTGAERLLGYSADEIVGHATTEIFFDPAEVQARSSALAAQLNRPIVGKQVLVDETLLGTKQEWTHIRKDGSRLTVALVVTELRDADGTRTGYLGVSYDMTRDKEREQRLREAMQEVEQASLAKGQFLANMSHEIRTPMNAILGMLKLLQTTSLNPQQQDYTTKTEGAARSLLSLLNDILDFSKIEAGKMVLDPQPFALDNLLQDLSVILAANVGNKTLEVLFRVAPDVPAAFIGDAMRLQQVLINLGGNAIKFTEAGSVVVDVSMVASHTDGDVVRFSVTDSGIGIAPENHRHIFAGFSQAEASTTRRFGGTGLGLSICRRLIEMMGGQLTLQSELGKGSTFAFAVPLKVATLPPPSSIDSAVLDSLEVLIVDDNPDAREAMAAMAKSQGWQAELAGNGLQALELVDKRKAAQRSPLDVVIIDWQMPGMDGWATLASLRKRFDSDFSPKFIMVTAYGRERLASRTPSEQKWLDAFLVKPITSGMLREAIVRARNTDAGEPHAYTPTKIKRLSGMRLLVVEDNLINQQVAKELLRSEGATIEIAGNGDLGVKAVAAANPPFDAVLMDLQMPVMDGYTASVTIRHELQQYDLPIIAMTANAMASDREACLAAGMNDHIGKPFELDLLVAMLLRHTGFDVPGTTTDLGPQVKPADSMDLEKPLEEEVVAEGTVEVDAAIARLEGNAQLYLQIARSFVAEVKAMPAQLGTAMDSSDWAQSARILHTFKGLSLTLGAHHLSQVCRKAETRVRELTKDPGVGPNVEFDRHATLLGVSEAVNAALTNLHAYLESRQTIAHNDLKADTKSDLDPDSLVADLEQLQNLLAASDMRALDAFAHLHKRHASSLCDELLPLQTAMEAFDFSQAVVQCQQLDKKFRASTKP